MISRRIEEATFEERIDICKSIEGEILDVLARNEGSCPTDELFELVSAQSEWVKADVAYALSFSHSWGVVAIDDYKQIVSLPGL